VQQITDWLSDAAWKKIHIAEHEVLIKEQGETGFSPGLIRSSWPKQEHTHASPPSPAIIVQLAR